MIVARLRAACHLSAINRGNCCRVDRLRSSGKNPISHAIGLDSPYSCSRN